MTVRCVVIGGGGHAAVVIDAMRLAGEAEPVAIVERDREMWGTDVLGVPVVGGDEEIPGLVAGGLGWFTVGVGGVGEGDLRRRLFRMGSSRFLRPVSVVHPSAILAADTKIGPGAQVMAGAVVAVGARVEANALINTRAVVDHDCRVRRSAHVASGAVLAGGVFVGLGAFVGAGATVIQGVRIGERAVVGAGAVVLDDVPDGAKVVGVPARARGGE